MQKNNQNVQFIQQIKLIADERHIPRDTVSDSFKEAIEKAYVKEYPDSVVRTTIDIDNCILEVSRALNVVEAYDDLNDYMEIAVEDAKGHKVGEVYFDPIDLSQLPRHVISHILQIFKHNISINSNKQVYKEWEMKVGQVVFAEVEKVDHKTGYATVVLENTFGFLPRHEAIPGEVLIPGQKYNFYIKEVKEQTKGWPIVVSRSDAGLVRYFLELQIPEIQEKLIEIKHISRIAGFKTKLSVVSRLQGIDAVGTVIGPKASRIKAIQSQIFEEKIEVIQYDSDFKKYIVNVCSPAEILGYAISEIDVPVRKKEWKKFDKSPVVENATETKEFEKRTSITLICRPEKLALLIGKKGMNARLISALLNADIDIVTLQDATDKNIKYERVDMTSMRQQGFNKIFNRYRSNNDVLSNMEGTNKIHTQQRKHIADLKGLDDANIGEDIFNDQKEEK